MALTESQLGDIVELYVEKIIDGMDTKTLERLVFDMLVDSYSSYTESELLSEIVEYYEDELSDMLESVGADPNVVI